MVLASIGSGVPTQMIFSLPMLACRQAAYGSIQAPNMIPQAVVGAIQSAQNDRVSGLREHSSAQSDHVGGQREHFSAQHIALRNCMMSHDFYIHNVTYFWPVMDVPPTEDMKIC